MAHTLTVFFERSTDLVAQRGNLAQGGLFLPWVEPAPEPFAPVELVIVGPGGQVAELPARVVHIAEGAGVALAFADAPAARQAIEALLAGPARGEGGPVRVQWGRVEGTATAPSEPAFDGELEPALEPESATLYDQIRTMNHPEKVRLAMHGDRAARLILMKDPNKTLHTFLLQNPRITLDEVRFLAGYRQANPEALKMIGDSRDWSQHAAVASALVSNPKTPTQTSLKLLDRLPQSELRRLAKSEHTPRAVQLAARKRVVGPG